MRSWENQLSWVWRSVCVYMWRRTASPLQRSEWRLAHSLAYVYIPTQRHTLTQYYKQLAMTAAAHMWIRMLTLVGCCKALSTDLCDFLWNPDLSFLSGCWFAVASAAHCSSSSIPLLLQALRACHIFCRHWLNPNSPVRDQTHLFISISLCQAVSITGYMRPTRA